MTGVQSNNTRYRNIKCTGRTGGEEREEAMRERRGKISVRRWWPLEHPCTGAAGIMMGGAEVEHVLLCLDNVICTPSVHSWCLAASIPPSLVTRSWVESRSWWRRKLEEERSLGRPGILASRQVSGQWMVVTLPSAELACSGWQMWAPLSQAAPNKAA